MRADILRSYPSIDPERVRVVYNGIDTDAFRESARHREAVRREIGVGAGLSKAEFGARLRYDIRSEFAPYIGVQYERAFGRTASYRRAEGEKAGALQLLIGVRTWF